MTTTIGDAFAAALAAKDGDGLRAVLDPDLDFRAMTPGQFWESSSADEVVDEIVLGAWFEPSDHITELVRVENGEVGHRRHLSYRLAVENGDGEHVVEHQAYYETDGSRITWLRIMCAGFVPVD
jgi:hypothetical protein